MQADALSLSQLLWGLVFILLAGVVSVVYRLRLEKDLLLGSLRTFAQLLVVGYLLQSIFDLNHPLLIGAIFIWMVFWAARAVQGRVREPQLSLFTPTFISMALSYGLITVMVTSLVLQISPWYQAQYFIALGGMIVGNAMNAASLALERLISGLKQGRAQIEMQLALGASPVEACRELRAEAMRTGMIPSINAMMTVGLVSLPGMMSGQILSGTAPEEAVKYQILVMLMLTGATALGTLLVVNWVLKRCFNRQMQITLGH